MGQQKLKWEVYLPKDSVWVTLGERGSVQELYLKLGKLPDPFVGNNEKLYQWIEEEDWHFKAQFNLSAEQLNSENLILSFPAIDTYAEVYLNGEHLGATNSCFHAWDFDIKEHGKLGNNVLSLYFESPVEHHRFMWENKDFRLPAPNDVNEIAIAPYSRKPQYQFGWDWSMRMNTIGLWHPAEIKSYQTQIAQARVSTVEILGQDARLRLHLNLQGSAFPKVLRSERFGDFVLEANKKEFVFEVEQKNIELWWPRGHGKQVLYKDQWQILDEQQNPLDQVEVSYGIRSANLNQQKDELGTAYAVMVNGRAIFCKGANVIPPTVFPGSEIDEDWRVLVDQAVEANFNMLRIWGGGYYPPDAFYDYCDEKGIMVWQDFMFACAMYPGDDAFLKVLQPEMDQQIPRISKHPSVVLFNGNNEVNVAWENWGFQVKYMLGPSAQRQIKEWYNAVFLNFIPEELKKHQVDQPYVHTSPLSNWGKKEDFNHGSQHYWGVWHGKDPIEDFGNKSGRFNAEYGFQSFPEMSTIHSFADSNDFDLNSEVMKHHQKSYVGNAMIEKHAEILYGKAGSFEDFVYDSQLTQAKAVSLAVSAHRIKAPICMGTIFWQLNDCWPAPTWSSIDYFGQRKLLHHQMQLDMEDFTVLQVENKLNQPVLYAQNMGIENFDGELIFKVYDLSGKQIDELREYLHLPYLENKKILSVWERFADQNVLIKAYWSHRGEAHKRIFSFLPNTRERAVESDVKYRLVQRGETAGEVIVETSSYIHSLYLRGLSVGIHFKENNLDLLPGRKVIDFTFPKNEFPEDVRLNWK